MMRILLSAVPRTILAMMMLATVLLALPEQGAAHEPRPAYLELPEGVTDLKPPVTQELADSRLERRRIDAGSDGLSGMRIDFSGQQFSINGPGSNA